MPFHFRKSGGNQKVFIHGGTVICIIFPIFAPHLKQLVIPNKDGCYYFKKKIEKKKTETKYQSAENQTIKRSTCH